MNFQIVYNSSKCEVIEEAIKRYKNRLFIQDCSRLNSNFLTAKSTSKTSFSSKKETSRNQKNQKKELLGVLNKLFIKFTGTVCETLPYLGMKESYSITVATQGLAEISSDSVWGVLRGMKELFFVQSLTNLLLPQKA